MNAFHSLENRARVLFAQRISRLCHLVSETLTRISTPPKAFHITHTSETKSPEDKKVDDVFHRRPFFARRCSMSSALCVFIHASETGHAEGVPIAPSRGRSIEFPSEGNYIIMHL